MPAGRHMRNTPSTTDIYHRQPSLSPANSKATHILNKDGTKLIAVPSRKVSNPDSRSLSNISNSSNSNRTSTSNFIQNSTTAANDYSAQIPDPLSSTVPSASMDYPHNASSNNVGGKKKKKKKGKQQQQQQQQQQPSTLSNNHNHSHDHGDHGHKGHRHDDYYDEPRYSRSNGPTSPNHRADQYQRDFKASMHDYDDHPPELVDPEDEEEYFSGPGYDDDDEDSYTPPIPTAPAPLAGKKKNKKKKKKGVNSTQELYQNSAVSSGGNLVGASKKKDRIWNTSTNEERERIKDFWLSLGEEERRSLVKVEKEAVLRKMKEQQKHSCSCGVCGRKRTAIEEELEVLYDAYYEELEQYAHQQQNSKYAAHSQSPGTYSAARIPPPPPPGPPPGNHVHPGHHHQGHRVEELDDEEFDDDDDDEYDDDDDDILDEPLPENDPRPDFFNFGNSLTVRGGILTVADDLLKNDGKKFIEMMEQLAERRMQREEEANAVATGHTSMNMSVGQNHIGHTHSQPQEYEDDEEYDEEEEDEEEYDEEEEDEPDTMTEEQRMEEGRKMFQIFAARMFEQRVLTAYREKVARERQDKLLEELDEEDQLRAQREEKKAKEKEKKKERRRLQKLAKEDERKKREAEKAEEEAKQRAIEDKKAEEVRRRKEEQRMKREAEKRAQEEERRRKDEERKKRLEEERERDAERERKRKENLDRERKRKEEFAKKAKEEKEAREKEVKEKRDREDRERKEREAKAKKELMERERIKKEEEAKAKAEIATVAAMVAAAATAKRPPVSIQTSIPVPHHHHHHHHHHHGVYNSPHLSVATPAMPKQLVGNSPARTRNASQQGSMQGSVASSPKTPQATPRIGSSASPNTPILQQNTPGSIILPNKLFQFPPHMPTSPLPHHIAPPPGVPPPENGFHMMNQMGMNGPSPIQPFLSGIPQRQPFGNGIPMYPPTQMPLGSNPQYRGFAAPNGMPMQVPATLGMRPMQPQGRGIFMGELAPSMHQLPPGVPLGVPPGSPFIGNRVEPVPIPGVHPHTRALSGSFEPIQRPTPIQRPSSVAPPRNLEDGLSSVDELSKVMGSRALLEDDEEDSMLEAQSPNRRGSSGIGFSPRPTRGLPAASPLFMDPTGHMGFPTPSWSNPAPLGTPLGNPLGNISNSLPNSAWSGAGWSETDAARSTFNRRRANRHDQIRSFATAKCRDLGGEKNNFIEISTLHRSVEQAAPELVITIKDLTDVLDMEGEILNGGGNFVTTYDTNGRILVRFEEDEKSIDGSGIYQAPGAPIGPHNHHPHPGEIGSPTDDGYAPPFKTVVGPPPGIAANGFPSGSEKLW